MIAIWLLWIGQIAAQCVAPPCIDVVASTAVVGDANDVVAGGLSPLHYQQTMFSSNTTLFVVSNDRSSVSVDDVVPLGVRACARALLLARFDGAARRSTRRARWSLAASMEPLPTACLRCASSGQRRRRRDE